MATTAAATAAAQEAAAAGEDAMVDVNAPVPSCFERQRSMADTQTRLAVQNDKLIIQQVKVELGVLRALRERSEEAKEEVSLCEEQMSYVSNLCQEVRLVQCQAHEAQVRSFIYHRTVASTATDELYRSFAARKYDADASPTPAFDEAEFLAMRPFLEAKHPRLVQQREQLASHIFGQQPATQNQLIEESKQQEELETLKRDVWNAAEQLYLLDSQVRQAEQELKQHKRECDQRMDEINSSHAALKDRQEPVKLLAQQFRGEAIKLPFIQPAAAPGQGQGQFKKKPPNTRPYPRTPARGGSGRQM